MTDIDEVWPVGTVRNDVADALILLEFIDAEIITEELTEGLDWDVEPTLCRVVRDYHLDRKNILQAIEVMQKGFV